MSLLFIPSNFLIFGELFSLFEFNLEAYCYRLDHVQYFPGVSPRFSRLSNFLDVEKSVQRSNRFRRPRFPLVPPNYD